MCNWQNQEGVACRILLYNGQAEFILGVKGLCSLKVKLQCSASHTTQHRCQHSTCCSGYLLCGSLTLLCTMAFWSDSLQTIIFRNCKQLCMFTTFLANKSLKIILVWKVKHPFNHWVAPFRWGLRHRKETVKSLGLTPCLWWFCLVNKGFKSLHCQSVSFCVREGRISKVGSEHLRRSGSFENLRLI